MQQQAEASAQKSPLAITTGNNNNITEVLAIGTKYTARLRLYTYTYGDGGGQSSLRESLRSPTTADGLGARIVDMSKYLLGSYTYIIMCINDSVRRWGDSIKISFAIVNNDLYYLFINIELMTCGMMSGDSPRRRSLSINCGGMTREHGNLDKMRRSLREYTGLLFVMLRFGDRAPAENKSLL